MKRISTFEVAAPLLILFAWAVIFIQNNLSGRDTLVKERDQASVLSKTEDRQLIGKPAEQSWLVIDRVYQIWLYHDGSENQQIQETIHYLVSQHLIVNNVSVTSWFARASKTQGTDLLSDEVANTVLFFVEK